MQVIVRRKSHRHPNICQVLYSVLISLSIFGSIYYKDELTHEEGESYIFTDRLYMVLGILHIIPLLLAIVLYTGVVAERYYYLKIYIFSKIFETIINTFVIFCICIFYALEIELYFAVLLCAAPLIIGLWSINCVVTVNVYYHKKLRLPYYIPDQNRSVENAVKAQRTEISNKNKGTETSINNSIIEVSSKY